MISLIVAFPLDEIANAIVERVQTLYLANQKVCEVDIEEYLTRKQVKEILQISYPTLNTWTKKGILKAYRIGGTKRYKKSEVDRALIEVNYGKTKCPF
jgi:excisionase family DNA binding protein